MYYSKMQGIVLAGGTGSRLYPVTKIVSKQLLLIYDKPLIYYPISTLMLAGIRKIQIICNERDLQKFTHILGNGSKLNMEISYKVQNSPEGLPDGIIKSQQFINNDNFAFILGDNFFYGSALGSNLRNIPFISGAHIFTYKVADPQNFGILETNLRNEIVDLVEKPTQPKSRNAITGLYFFSPDAVEYSKSLDKSKRNELEMVDLLKKYFEDNRLTYTTIPRGTIWLDTGNFDSLLETSQYVKIVQERQNQLVANLEEIAWRNGWITNADLEKCALSENNSKIREYLLSLLT
jgi:glucose-1-phosphate thymidylyltransferase